MPSGFSKKERFQQSGTTVVRYREPTSACVENAMQFVQDFKRNSPVVPGPRRTMNRSGTSAALGALSGASLGSAPDERGFSSRARGGK